jgi:hypothetical protein
VQVDQGSNRSLNILKLFEQLYLSQSEAFKTPQLAYELQISPCSSTKAIWHSAHGLRPLYQHF